MIVRYPGPPRATGGVISAGSGSAAGHTLHTFTASGDDVLDFNLVQTLSAPLTGPGGFHLTGTGTLVLAGENTYLGETRITGGILQVGNGGTRGNLGAGTVTNNGTLVVRRADAVTLAQPLHGSGTLVHAGPQRLTLTANNPFTGNLVLEDGPLTLAETGTLAFRIGRNGSSNRISGPGSATIRGAFQLLLADGPLRIHGSAWSLCDATRTTFGPAFAVTSDLGAFTRDDAGRHVLEENGRRWVFSEVTGLLTLAAPEPGTFTAWIDGFFPGETGGHITGPRADPEGDGLANTVEFILGGHPGRQDAAIRPESAREINPPGLPDGDFLRYSFRRTNSSRDAGVEPLVEFSDDLETWHTAADGAQGVTMTVATDAHGPGIDRVDVFIPAAADGSMFARLAGIDTRPPGDPDQPPLTLEFGVITDVHFGYFPNAAAYLTEFIGDMHAWDPDFIIQLGDFCRPEAASNNFMAIYNSWPGPRYHVIGNHERDGGYTFQQAAGFWGMPARYHTFDQGPVRGIVMDGNEPGGSGTGYAAFVSPVQQNWLAQQLAATDRPVIIFIHQPVEFLENGSQVRAIIEAAEAARPGTVIAVVSGHLHRDYARVINNIPYLQVNSATYFYYNGRVDYTAPLWARI
ncbi:MAG: metallophosphoesterase, partial [Akkermansiaceae bacterium]|nr:metallophosphoesterase [Akkermansiaceae bacterium]